MKILYSYATLNRKIFRCDILTKISNLHQEMSSKKILNKETVNQNFKNVEYAVRGKIVEMAGEFEEQLRIGKKFPFDKVIKANIGDCHAVGQRPITFFRQVLAACAYPEMMEKSEFPSDVVERAKEILHATRSGIGSYTDSVGIKFVREKVAKFITTRDGDIPSFHKNIILANGASSAIKLVLSALMTGQEGSNRTGIMVPIPMYPLYSAIISEYNGFGIGYYLDESNNWSLQMSELERAYNESVDCCKPRALVVINPGNPTGQLLTEENMREIIDFCYRKRLLLLADEVYQENIYVRDRKFHSFKKILHQMGEKYNNFELASFHSISKGFYGECGLRGGYVELHGFDPDVQQFLVKLQSTQLCSSSTGQIVLCCMVDPPTPGMESYPLYNSERTMILDELRSKAEFSCKSFNQIPGITCNPIHGALYAFVRIMLPEKSIKVAQELNIEPDKFYCMELLEKTGVCFIPGSGFSQYPGTYHFRTTILPQMCEMKEIIGKVTKFQVEFLSKYS